jgi:helix-turn-helix protein
VTADRNTFGPRLKRERERRGVALKAIADSTKLKESLFVELERNDFSNWPEGIFRRAHICAYASAIGLPPQPILAEYLRLFNDAPPEDVRATQATDAQPPAKTTKASAPSSCWADRVWVASFDAAAVFLISSIVAGITGLSLLPAMALAGLPYFAIGSAWVAQSPGRHLQQRIHAAVDAGRQPKATATVPRLELQPIVFKQTRPSVSQSTLERQVEVIEDRRASA